MVKKSNQTPEDRGYLESSVTNPELSLNDKLNLLHSHIPVERTLGARLLATEKSSDVVDALIIALKNEKKLYSKIEICNSLVSIGEKAVAPLIEELGKIGKNQHKTVPQEEFRKVSYPLPRDIVARTLSYMGVTALPQLLSTLITSDIPKLSEVIDAIGYICFYDYQKDIFPLLKQCYENNSSELIHWKTIRAMSAFPESKSFLEEEQKSIQDKGVLMEIARSLKLISRKK